MRLHPGELLSRLNSSYWFVPLLVTLGGMGLAALLLRIDAVTGATLPVLRSSSPESARALLSAVIGAMITAISVTFSVTVVALTVAAQHFGPRVLNNFVRQTSAQVVLGTFMATFVYAVLVLGTIRGTGPDVELPALAVGGAVLLVILSVGALIYYVHYVSTSLQIGELAAEIGADFRTAVRRLHGDEQERVDEEAGEIPEAPPDVSAIPAHETGYVQRIDYGEILALATERDAVVWMRREPGSFMVAGTPLALVTPAGAGDGELVRALQELCIVGRDRTFWQDAEFAVKQLVEIALRALSPGVNEPFTAITCIDQLTAGLAAAATTPRPQSTWRDATGRARVYSQRQPFETLLRASFDPIRIFAGANPAIYARLLEAINELALVATRREDRAALQHQAEVILRSAQSALADPDDRAYVGERHRHTAEQFHGVPSSTRR